MLCATAVMGTANAGTLVMESWRVDDKALWETVLIPAFSKGHPGIDIKFSPTAPTEYDSSLLARFGSGTVGDLVACRPFDVSQTLYSKGYLDKLDGKPGMEHFEATALLAWQSDDARTTFCMPVASVIHGFLYNKKIFKKLNLQAPKTEAEFLSVLDAIKKNGSYVPLALGTAEKWEATQTLFTSIGPNYWRGETGRKALISGKAKFTDAAFVAAFDYEKKLSAYLPNTASTQSYSDSQHQFASGRAAVYPVGSWDISYFNQVAGLEFGVFAPPVRAAGDKCYILDHMDIGIGINKKSRNKEDAYKFLEWLGSQEFADIYTNRVTGFFSLSNHLIAVRDPIGKQMMEWRTACESSIRVNAQILNRGQPSLEQELWSVNADVLNGNLSGKDAASRIQNGLSASYKSLRK
ncbi:carbohydrate ABC transporter substrate-binding protein [Undibacterium sp. CY18W]|uniref:Probable sugar-binding periplasmic protein n=1 Tax=Undibacterium hunanense TaxID=2762292 RepID=A0ABR6ZLG2_9BURK|nr:ABC transporter substrate-binding protein [Undibacterium hunanense]MBC3916727.1 carbohydrate ABC transporter substrate-binding protein [Undibacterium hunanense]